MSGPFRIIDRIDTPLKASETWTSIAVDTGVEGPGLASLHIFSQSGCLGTMENSSDQLNWVTFAEVESIPNRMQKFLGRPGRQFVQVKVLNDLNKAITGVFFAIFSFARD